jgi:two-component system sensor histidine kinase ChvG
MTVEMGQHLPMGDKTADTKAVKAPWYLVWPGKVFRQFSRIFHINLFSSITRRIVFLNLAALVILLSGILYLSQFRAGLTDARVESLLIQGQIIASAIAASATVETDAITIDPEKLLELQAGDSLMPRDDSLNSLDFPIDPEQVAPVLRQLISPTRTRARIYDPNGLIILDSRHLYSRGQILRYDLPALSSEKKSFFDHLDDFINGWLLRSDLPLYTEVPGADGTSFPEVVRALTGAPASVVRVDKTGRLMVSVAVPVQRFRAVLGVLLLSTIGGDIDKIVRAERLAIARVTAVAAIVSILLAIILASTIAQPLRRLSAAADHIRIKGKTRQEIPDFSDRHDEIGNLSLALRDMTSSLYSRIEAIESFAADVSHELKNPLTSLRSAVETLPIVKTDEQRKRLLDVILHDVQRLDRLITDISNASRLDAELAREDIGAVDLAQLLEKIQTLHDSLDRPGISIRFKIDDATDAARSSLQFRKKTRGRRGSIKSKTSQNGRFVVYGIESRFGQVISNLLDNACSFVPADGGEILVSLERDDGWVVLKVEDNGPGIQAEQIERIFERFYTDRPAQEDFGQNSGLGLSISKQIIEAHDGTITAQNIKREGGTTGALFTVRLPAEAPE